MSFESLAAGPNTPRYNNYVVPNITFKHAKGLGKGNNIINIRYYLSVQIPPIMFKFHQKYLFKTSWALVEPNFKPARTSLKINQIWWKQLYLNPRVEL